MFLFILLFQKYFWNAIVSQGKSQSDERKLICKHVHVVCGFVPCLSSWSLLWLVTTPKNNLEIFQGLWFSEFDGKSFTEQKKTFLEKNLPIIYCLLILQLKLRCNFIREKVKFNAYKLKVNHLIWLWTPVFVFLCLAWFGVGFQMTSWSLTSKGFCIFVPYMYSGVFV